MDESGARSASNAPWWREGVIYEIPVASFADSNGDGVGDLRGVIDKLDYLNDGTDASLGVDAIWLTPINPSPMRDFGYDVADYYSINPKFGTMPDFDELLGECHVRGIKLMLDLVLNHTSDEHPWFVESRSSKDNPKRDWYIWREGRTPHAPPNRWVSVAEGSAWRQDPATEQYYYHAFLPFQPDLNWRNPEVRDELLGVMRFWLDKGVDGFRLDLINFLYEDEQFRDNPPRLGRRPYFWQHHVYDRSRPESIDAVKAMRRLTDEYDDRAIMGEVFTDVSEDVTDYLGDGTDALHLSFYLDFARRPWSAKHFRDSVGWLEANLPDGAWPCYYLNNHDLARAVSRLGGRHADARAKVAAAMLMTLRGTPILYSGEEIGMRMSRVPRQRMKDPLGTMYWPLTQGRDGARTPMQWTAGPQAGFTAGEPWLPVDPTHTTKNVERQLGAHDSMLSWYRKLIALRAATRSLRAGSYRVLADAPRDVYAYVREADEERTAVFLNFASGRRSLRGLDGTLSAGATVLLSTHRGPGQPVDATGLELAPHEVLLVRLG